MRQLRWKKAYLTGNPGVDACKCGIYDYLRATREALSRVECCQDYTDLLARIDRWAAEFFKARAKPDTSADSIVEPHRAELAEILRSGLPLPALHTPACRQCGECERLEASLAGWCSKAADS